MNEPLDYGTRVCACLCSKLMSYEPYTPYTAGSELSTPKQAMTARRRERHEYSDFFKS